MTDENHPTIQRVCVASNISGTVLADYTTPAFQCTHEDRTIASFFRSMMAMAKEFDDGELKLVSFGSTGPQGGSPLLNSGTATVQQSSNSLNLALFMKNDIIVGVLYTAFGDDVPPKQREKMNKLTKKLYKGFADEHLEFYLTEEVHDKLNQAFQQSEDLPAKLKDRFASFSKKIPEILDSSS